MTAQKPGSASPSSKPEEVEAILSRAPAGPAQQEQQERNSGSGLAAAAALSAVGMGLASQSATYAGEVALQADPALEDTTAHAGGSAGLHVTEAPVADVQASDEAAAQAALAEAEFFAQGELTAVEDTAAAVEVVAELPSFAPPLGDDGIEGAGETPIYTAVNTTLPAATISGAVASSAGQSSSPVTQVVAPVLGQGGLVNTVVDVVNDGVLQPILGEGGLVDSLLDPVLGEDGLIPGVIDTVVDDVLNPILGEDGLLGEVLAPVLGEDGIVAGVLEPILGEDGLLGGLVGGVLDPLLGEDGLAGQVLDPLLGQDGVLGTVLEPVLGEDGIVTGVVEVITDGVLDPLLGQDGVLGTVLDPVLGEGGVLDTVVAPILGDDGPLNYVLDPLVGEDGIITAAVEPVLGGDGILGDLLAPVVGEEGLLGDVLAPVIGNDGILDSVLTPVYDALGPVGDLLGSLTSGLLGGTDWSDGAESASTTAAAALVDTASDGITTDILPELADLPQEIVSVASDLVESVLPLDGDDILGDDGFLDSLLEPTLISEPLDSAEGLADALGSVIDPIFEDLLSDDGLMALDLGAVTLTDGDPLGDLLGIDLTGTLVDGDGADTGSALGLLGTDPEIDHLLNEILDSGERVIGGLTDPLTELLDFADAGTTDPSDAGLFNLDQAVEGALSTLLGDGASGEADLLASVNDDGGLLGNLLHVDDDH